MEAFLSEVKGKTSQGAGTTSRGSKPALQCGATELPQALAAREGWAYKDSEQSSVGCGPVFEFLRGLNPPSDAQKGSNRDSHTTTH